MSTIRQVWIGLLASVAAVTLASAPAFAQKKPNVVMLMTDDTGWNDFGRTQVVARRLATPRRISIESPRKALYSRTGTARRAARQAALRL